MEPDFTCVAMDTLLRSITLLLALWLACVAATAFSQPAPVAVDLNETVVSIPVMVNGKPTGSSMVGTVFKPNGDGPFPFVVLNNPEGLVAVINFAGGHGGRPDREPGNPCATEKLKLVFAQAGKTSRVPALWVYAENDQYFSPQHSRAWHEAFTAAGGQAEFKLLPPFEKDGHTLFARGASVWQPVVGEFLKTVGF